MSTINGAICFRVTAILLAVVGGVNYAEDWPMWRGPRGDGTSLETDVPLSWSPNKNIAWKTPIPGQGRSSPIVCGDAVFVTTVMPDSQSRRLLKLNRASGVVEWNQELLIGPREQQHRFNTSASSTPATDGALIYCVAVDDQRMYVVACDYEGKMHWRASPGTFESKHGFAASPLLFEETIIVNGHQDGDAFVVALDCRTGREVWRYIPEVRLRSFSSPVLIKLDEGPQVILTGANQTVGIDPKSGKRIWYAEGPSEKSVSTPSVGLGMVFSFAGSPSPRAMAIRLGGEGDVSTTHVVWDAARAMPYVPTPLLAGKYLHVINDVGIYSCIEPETGKVLKVVRRGGNTYSSPVSVRNRIYLFEDNGQCTVIRNDAAFHVLARNELGEGTQCTPAISNGSLFVRTEDHLWRIAELPSGVPP